MRSDLIMEHGVGANSTHGEQLSRSIGCEAARAGNEPSQSLKFHNQGVGLFRIVSLYIVK